MASEKHDFLTEAFLPAGGNLSATVMSQERVAVRVISFSLDKYIRRRSLSFDGSTGTLSSGVYLSVCDMFYAK